VVEVDNYRIYIYIRSRGRTVAEIDGDSSDEIGSGDGDISSGGSGGGSNGGGGGSSGGGGE